MESATAMSNEFGPFTPQELEKVVDWLKSKNLKFEIGKDQHVEDLFRLNDGRNIIKQAEFRTEVYLAQIFVVQVQNMDDNLRSEFNQFFSLSEKIPQRFLSGTVADDSASRMKSQQRKKMIWAGIAAFIMGAPILFSIIKILFKGE